MSGVVAALFLAVLLATWTTWPIAPRAATHVPGGTPFDVFYLAWALAWQTHALVTDPLRLAEANIYHPTPHALFYGPPGFALLPLFAPLFLATGRAVLALNLTWLAALVLSALVTHLVAWRWSGSWTAGAVAAGTLWATPAFVRATSQIMQHSALIPYPLLVYAAARAATSRRWLLAVVPLATVQCLADPVYVAPGVLFPLGLLAAVRVLRPSTRRAGLELCAALVGVAVLLAPVAAGYEVVRAANPNLLTQTVWDKPGLFSRAWRAPLVPTAVSTGLVAFAAIGALLALSRRGSPPAGPAAGQGDASTAWGHVLLWAGSGLVLVLWSDAIRAALLPGDAGPPIRIPVRLGWGTLVAAALACGLAFPEWRGLLQRWGLPQLAATAAVVALFGAGTAPEHRQLLRTPNEPVPAPAPGPDAAVVAAHPGPVLELPIGRRGVSPPLNTKAMVRSTGHWQPLLNGYASYWPAGQLERMALANRLPDPQALAVLRRDTGLVTVVIRLSELSGPDAARWRQVASRPSAGLRPLADLPDALVFAVEP